MYGKRALLLCSLIALANASSLLIRDGDEHGHGHHGAPLVELNETQVTLYHAPTPPSYYTIDWEDATNREHRYPALMIIHVLLMSSAFFVALPIGIALRSVKSTWHAAAVILFYGLCALGVASSALYTKLTPNMYQGSVHGKQGWAVLVFSLALTSVDVYSIFRRIIAYFRGGVKFTIASFWSSAVLGRDVLSTSLLSEYTGLVTDEPDEFQESKNINIRRGLHDPHHDEDAPHFSTAQWASNVHRHRREYSHSTLCNRSVHSDDDTLHDLDYIVPNPKPPLAKRIPRAAFATCERALVLAGLAQFLTGIVIYTGGCRENYINGCLAHLIKGAIFWCYGLLTFARFLGSFSEYGWSWNRAPSGDCVSAEFVESFVIFFYGITNTWMERFGANPGDPYTAKQIQHIGIAVMFWFAGLLGMAIESKRVRNWLASSTISALQPSKLSQKAVAEPPSYIASFNPFPALVIGITGAAMAAHMQTYLFQVQIHELWGNLLVSFSVMRCLTYFFLWLGPPRSILPSRPPTEALGSFFLACGGLVFMFSTEEVTFAAMRRGKDDIMMFTTVSVAITCFAFCWTTCVVAFKGWLRSRTQPKVSYHSSA